MTTMPHGAIITIVLKTHFTAGGNIYRRYVTGMNVVEAKWPEC